MYNKISNLKNPAELPISLENKLRRLTMEKKAKIGLMFGILACTLFYVAYSLHTRGVRLVVVDSPSSNNFVRSCPLTKPVKTETGALSYRIGIVTDMDENSKHPTKSFTWISYFKRGNLILSKMAGKDGRKVSIKWSDENIILKSSLAQGGRGMELSELICFDGKILSNDDRTGVVYQIIDQHVTPWAIMADGDGREVKGFKGEWATVKDGQLYVGGLGKEWTTSMGKLLNFNPQYVKIISSSGSVMHVNWVENYRKLLKAAGIEPPGYLIHESAAWSKVNKKWYFYLAEQAKNDMMTK